MSRLFRTFVCLAVFVSSLTVQAVTLDKEQALGRMLFHDQNLSLHRNQSCASCHQIEPAADPNRGGQLKTGGFADPVNVVSGTPSSLGSVPGKAGTLNSPSAAYAMFSPYFHWDAQEGHYVGGQFWNGRAATLADQAKGPPLNPLEMAMPSKWAVVTRLKANSDYVTGFRELYGIDLAAIPAKELASPEETSPPGVPAAYDAMARAIAAFEKSRVFAPFTSKYDFYLAGKTELSSLELKGLAVWNMPKSQCSACHVSASMKAPGGGELPPMFTDFTYDNLGLPYNANLPGKPLPDPGLGGRPDIAALDPDGEQLGKHKVMTIRNIEVTGPYMHNGVLPTLEAVVHFYNTRDAKPRACSDNRDRGFGKECWPEPEIGKNVNRDELGNLGLDAEEERAIVAIMKTLTDGYPEWGGDPKVPPGTPSPYADVAFPPFP
jgi:cytochrome c peroxidase